MTRQADVERRIADLERRLAYHRVVASIVVAAVGVVLLVAQGREAGKGGLVGSSLTLTDRQGRTRIRILVDPEPNESTLQFMDERGQTWLRAGVVGGEARFEVRSEGGASVVASADGKGEVCAYAGPTLSSITLADQRANRVEVQSVNNGQCGMVFSDRAGRRRLGAVVHQNPALWLADEAAVRGAFGTLEAVKGEETEAAYGITLLDKKKRIVWHVPR